MTQIGISELSNGLFDFTHIKILLRPIIKGIKKIFMKSDFFCGMTVIMSKFEEYHKLWLKEFFSWLQMNVNGE